MPQALVNHSLDSISAGVTQQYQEGRHESQVEEMLNCLPSLTRGVLRRNPIYKHPTLSTGTLSDPFTYSYDRGNGDEQYVLVIPTTLTGEWYVYNVNDVTKTWSGTNSYFATPVGAKAKDILEALTIGDHTFIVNSTVTVAQSTGNNTLPIANYSSWAFYWVKLTTQVVTDQETVDADTGSRLEGYSYSLKTHTVVAEKDTRPSTGTDPDLLSAYKIATEMATNEAAWTNDTNSAFVYSTTNTIDWDWSDSNGSLASLGVWNTIPSATELPAYLPSSLDGFIVRITGGSSITEDDYYLQYDDTNKTWTECAAPAAKLGLDYSTMPHVLYALGTPTARTFVVDTYQEVDTAGTGLTGVSQWKDRVVGDETTNGDPSFVGDSITSIFFYQNRLGFLSRDTIVLSRTSDYGNFYLETIQSILDDGPVDLTVATTDVVTLRHAVPTEDSLIIFADEAQLSLSSPNAVFGPNTAYISVLANYNYAPNMDAKALGNQIFFGSISGGYAQLYAMEVNVNDYTRNTQAEALTLHIPSYINKGVDKLVGHDVLGQMFIHSENLPNILYVVSSAKINGEKVQQAFHTWEFESNIVGVHIINNELYLIFEEGTLATMSLEIPGDVTTITYEDVQPTGAPREYVSGITFSQFYYRDERNRGTKRGRFQLRTMEYSVDEGSAYQTVIRNVTKYDTELTDNAFGTTWEEPDVWDDTLYWVDASPDYDRIYKNDDKITVMSSAANVKIVFRNNEDLPTGGFELETVNIEALFYQRSQRT